MPNVGRYGAEFRWQGFQSRHVSCSHLFLFLTDRTLKFMCKLQHSVTCASSAQGLYHVPRASMPCCRMQQIQLSFNAFVAHLGLEGTSCPFSHPRLSFPLLSHNFFLAPSFFLSLTWHGKALSLHPLALFGTCLFISATYIRRHRKSTTLEGTCSMPCLRRKLYRGVQSRAHTSSDLSSILSSLDCHIFA